MDNNKKVIFFAIAKDFLGEIGTDPVHRLEVPNGYCQPRGPCLGLGGLQLQALRACINMLFDII